MRREKQGLVPSLTEQFLFKLNRNPPKQRKIAFLEAQRTHPVLLSKKEIKKSLRKEETLQFQ